MNPRPRPIREHARPLVALVTAVAMLAGAAAAGPARAASVLLVNATDDVDDGVCDATHCSLREAVVAANADTAHDVIEFAVSGAITTTGLPTVTRPVTIDGTTNVGRVDIVSSGSTGLQLNGAGSVVRGLAIRRSVTGFPSAALVLGAAGITVADNHLNLDAAGTTVSTFNVALDVYAGGHRIEGNVVASPSYGILVRGGSTGTGGNAIVDNLIGTDASGTTALSDPNSGPGIEIRPDAGGNLIHGNVVSSHYAGVTIGGSSDNVITGNHIGTDITGTVDLGNRAAGLSIGNSWSGGQEHVATGNRVGGTAAGERNVISGNGEPNLIGTGLTVGGADNVVVGNFIGTDASGTSPLPNARGVQVQSGTGIVIGGSGPGEGNVISGNHENGLQFSFEAGGSRAAGNLIGVAADGVTPLGNGANGVAASGLSDGAGVTIGGSGPAEGNVIAHNGGTSGRAGVFVGHTSRKVSILGNAIHANTGPGIELIHPHPSDPWNATGWGPTPNDGGSADDADTGGNDLVNFPVLTGLTVGPSSTTVEGSLDGLPSTTFRVEVFGSDGCDPSGHGEGERFLGATSVTTDGNGEATFSASVTTPAPASAITATATDPSGNTSEFSACVLDSREPVAEPGRVTIVKATDPTGGSGFTFTGPAGATPDGAGTLGQGGDAVVFHRNSQGLYLLDVATRTETFLAGTEGGGYPEFSPDAARIAFVASASGHRPIAVHDLATGAIEQLTTGLYAQAPSWSPDGGWIVFHASGDLWVVPSDGSAPATQLTATAAHESFPVWAGDGRIAWRTNGATPNVRVATFDAATSELVGETGLAGLPSQHREMHWSPDGTQLAAGAAFDAASDTYLHVLTDDGTGTWTATQLTDDGDASDKSSYDHQPTWTPDGSSIIYAGRNPADPTDSNLYRIAPDGTGTPELFHGTAASEAGPDWGQASTTSTYTLDDGDSIGGWVPSGSAVTFAELPADGYTLGGIECDSPSASIDLASRSVTIAPAPSEHVTCTFTNVLEARDGDGDGVTDDTDNCAAAANADQADLDGDGTGDACDDDIDGDGLSNIIEIWLGCDPYRVDSDGDGLWDLVEVLVGTNPLLGDSDDDGESDGDWLLRIVRQLCGCAIELQDDGNGNGVWDVVEWHFFGALHDPGTHGGGGDGTLVEYLFHLCGCGPDDDVDANGIPDTVDRVWGGGNLLRYVIRCGCSPWEDTEGGGGRWYRLVQLGGGIVEDDTDGDGIPDLIEILLGCDPTAGDSDGDGLSDHDELFRYGTDPNDPDSDDDVVLDGVDPAPLAGVTTCAPTVSTPVPVGTTVQLDVTTTGAPTTLGVDWGDGTPATTIASPPPATSVEHRYDTAGVHLVTCTVTDATTGRQSHEYRYVVVYDPDGGFVTGGGWIDSPAGAYPADPTATGKASFGFVSKYQKGADVPTGSTEFQFRAGDLNFHSSTYEWLVVAGASAKFKGVGTINGAGDYGFMITATDSALAGGGTSDALRIKIWDRASGDVIYDNQLGASEDSDAATALGGGSIVIHRSK